MLPREPVRAHREAQIQPALVRRPQHVFAQRRPPGLGVEGGGLLVGARTDHWELVFLGELNRLVKVALRLGVLPARSRPRSLDQGIRCRVVFRCARRPLAVQRQCLRTKRAVERSRGAHWIMLRAPIT